MSRFIRLFLYVRPVVTVLLLLVFIVDSVIVAVTDLFTIGVNHATWLVDVEMPLSQVNGIAVDSTGNVYVGSRKYSRIQVYSREGAFLRGFYLGRNIKGVDFRFRVNEADEVEVYGLGVEILCVFDRAGMRARRTDVGHIPFSPVSCVGTNDADGNSYSLAANSWAMARVLKTDKNGYTRPLIVQPWFLTAIKQPFPAFALGGVAVLGLWLMHGPSRWWRSRRR